MKIFLSYKFSGVDRKSLRVLIDCVSEKLESLGHTTFCFSRDIQHWGDTNISRSKIIPTALINLDSCDLLLAVIDEEGASTGVGIEVGYAQAKGKKVFLATREGVGADYVASLADKVLEYYSIQTLKESLESLFI